MQRKTQTRHHQRHQTNQHGIHADATPTLVHHLLTQAFLVFGQLALSLINECGKCLLGRHYLGI